MCIASVRDCRALAAAQPVDVTKARIPWFINSHAGQRKGKVVRSGFEKKGNKDTVVRDRIEEEERKSRYMEETGMGKREEKEWIRTWLDMLSKSILTVINFKIFIPK